MKILALTNFYPPHHLGGYELGCRDVLERLRRRGWEVSVLTSSHRIAGAREAKSEEVPVWRELGLLGSSYRFSDVLRREIHDNACLRRRLRAAKPDLVFVWNMSRLPMSLLYALQSLRMPAAYYVSDTWLAEKFHRDPWLSWWIGRGDRGWKRGGKALLRALGVKRLVSHLVTADFGPLDCRHVVFTSETYKQRALQAGFPVADALVIPWGCDPQLFHPRPKDPNQSPLRLLCVGQVQWGKGFHTAIDAVASVVGTHGPQSIRLTVVGRVLDSGYFERLRRLIQEHDLVEVVTFLEPVLHEQMADLYHAHDVLLFPAVHEEALSITLLEAMACGMLVISTTTGGNREILEDGINALVIPPGDASALAARIGAAIRDRGLILTLGVAGADFVKRKFLIDHTVDRIHELLSAVIARPAGGRDLR